MYSSLRSSGVIAIVLVMSFGVVYAAPPASPYNLGETLSPNCAPGDVNCTVTPPQPHHNYLDDVSAVSALAGDLLYFDGSNWVDLGMGVAGQVLTASVAGLPSWQNVSVPSLWSLSGTDLSPATAGNDVLLNAKETLTLSDFTQGGLVFAGIGGLLSEDAGNLFWDNSNKRLGIGLSGPSRQLELSRSMEIPNTTNNSSGVIYKGGRSFIHNYPWNGCSMGVCGNTFLGLDSGNFSISTSPAMQDGSRNTGVGYKTLNSLTNGYDNTAIGTSALESLTSGIGNNAIGALAMQNNQGGHRNVAIGQQSLYLNVSGSDNIAIGHQSLITNTGSYNNSIGTFAMRSNTSGSNNVAMGRWALYNNQSGSNNTVIGDETGAGSSAFSASRNTFLGYKTGHAIQNGANDNTLVGYRAGYNITTGDHNILLGTGAGFNITSGSRNIVIGNDQNVTDPTADHQLDIGQYIFGRVNGGIWRVGIFKNDPKTTLDVAGGVKLGVENLCDADREGTIRYRTGSPGHFTGCRLASDGTTYEWVQLDN